MANRYWVGGTAAWDGTAGTKWALTSGAAGGQAVPTAADDVFFDGASGAVTCTVTGARVAKSINCTGFTGTLAGATSPSLTISGSLTLVAGMTLTYAGTTTFNATGTLTSGGKTLGAVTVNGAGITVTLGDALNTGSGALTITAGTLTTSASNYSVTAGSISSSNSNVRTISLNGSTITLSAATPINFSTSTNLTFNAGTSQINVTANNATLSTSGITYYNLSFTSTSAANNKFITNSNTFNNLTITAPIGNNYLGLYLSANQTVNGTLTCAGASSLRRVLLASSVNGTTRTVTAAAISADDCDFRDITISGAAAGSSPTRAGDCGGNSGITFPAAKTVYRVGTNTTWAGSASWALSSGAGGSDNNFPLAQDTAVIDNNSTPTGATLFSQQYNLGSLDCSTKTGGITLDLGGSFNIHGSFILGSGVTIAAGNTQYFYTIGTQTINTAGKTLQFPMFIEARGTLQLGAALNCSAATGITHYAGTFSAVTYNVTCVIFDSNYSNTRTLNMGSGTWTLTGTGTVWNFATVTGLTLNKDTANILLSNTTTTARTFAGGGQTYNKLTIGGATGTSTLTFTGSNTFSELASTKTVAHTLSFTGGTTQTVGAWTITGTVGNVVTIQSSAAASHTLTKTGGGIVSADYLSISRSTATPSDTWYAGANSTNGGSNSGWIFTAPPTAGGNMFFMFS